MEFGSEMRGLAVLRRVGRLAVVFAAAAALSTAALAAPSDNVFTVANYPVEARAENAVAAKTKALAEGQQAALRSLLKRLVPVTAYQRLRQLRQVPAGEMIEGVSVRSERNSTTDYIANLDFSFQAQAVRGLDDAVAPGAEELAVLVEDGDGLLAAMKDEEVVVLVGGHGGGGAELEAGRELQPVRNWAVFGNLIAIAIRPRQERQASQECHAGHE